MGRAKKPRTPQAARSSKRAPGPGRGAAKSPAAGAGSGGPERLQKLLARAGYGSRRACEELIADGRVTVDGAVVSEAGVRADPAIQKVAVDGNRLRLEAPVYYLVNKPKNVLCTSADPQGRATVVDLIPHEKRRIFSVGRLDNDSRGAVILTNDGSFTNLLTHPRYGIEKTYNVRVRGVIADESLERLREGLWLSEGKTLPAKVWVVKRRPEETELGITICEGKNRQVRRMFAKVGHKVLALTRTRIGPLTLRTLPDGGWRELRPREVDDLRRLARENARQPAPRGPGRKGTRAKSLGKPDPKETVALAEEAAAAAAALAAELAESQDGERRRTRRPARKPRSPGQAKSAGRGGESGGGDGGRERRRKSESSERRGGSPSRRRAKQKRNSKAAAGGGRGRGAPKSGRAGGSRARGKKKTKPGRKR